MIRNVGGLSGAFLFSNIEPILNLKSFPNCCGNFARLIALCLDVCARFIGIKAFLIAINRPEGLIRKHTRW